MFTFSNVKEQNSSHVQQGEPTGCEKMCDRVRPGRRPLTPCCFLSMGSISPILPRTVPGVITLQKGQRFDWPTGATLRSDG